MIDATGRSASFNRCRPEERMGRTGRVDCLLTFIASAALSRCRGLLMREKLHSRHVRDGQGSCAALVPRWLNTHQTSNGEDGWNGIYCCVSNASSTPSVSWASDLLTFTTQNKTSPSKHTTVRSVVIYEVHATYVLHEIATVNPRHHLAHGPLQGVGRCCQAYPIRCHV